MPSNAKIDMQQPSSIKISVVALLFIIVFSYATADFWQAWKKKTGTPFTWDVELYYSYLPATFIHHDLSFKYDDKLPMQVLENGNKNPKYTCGMAIMYAPFFYIGHQMAKYQNCKLDGLSEPYATAIHFGSIFYVILGLFFLRKISLQFYSENITALLLIIAYFGTNLFNYTLRDGEYSHGYLFCLVCIYTYFIIAWHKQPKYSTSIFIGLLIGLITLIRPTDALFYIVFLLYGVKNKLDLKEKLHLFIVHKWKIAVIFIFGIIMLLPQIIFWKIYTGHYVFFSYNQERFFFADPKIWEVLFSYRKGFFVYTPIMILSVFGVFFMKKRIQEFQFGIILFFVINLYIVSSWWCWWYGGSFGMRALIETYPLLLLAMGAFFHHVFSVVSKSKIIDTIKKYGVISFVIVCICLNMIQTYECKVGLMHFDSMNKETYWQIFDEFDYESHEDYDQYIKSLTKIDYDKAINGTDREDH